MIRTIKQHIYVIGLLPLALLAVALVGFNGVARIDEANRELRNARNVTAALLQSPALDALVVGNTLSFEQTVSDVIKTSPFLVCVRLRDAKHRVVAQGGACDEALLDIEYLPVTAPTSGFSDFAEPSATGSPVGDLGILMSNEVVKRKRAQVLPQLGISLLMIALVVAFTGRLLRARLVEPIQRIHGAMRALSQRDYTIRVPTRGHDELTTLAEATNSTIATIAEYTRELERRRSEADQALHDADAANLARGGLVRSLTEDLAGPMGLMHSELTAIAMANRDPLLKDRIRTVLGLLQEAQTDLADLVEIASNVERTKALPWRDVADIWADIKADVQRLSDSERIPVNFVVTQMTAGEAVRSEPAGLLLSVDAVRLKKALVYLIRAMGRRCKHPGVYVNAELIKRTEDQLHLSVHLIAFYGGISGAPTVRSEESRAQQGYALPVTVGLTDLESKVIDYLLRTIGFTATVSASPTGAVTVLLDTTCGYTVDSVSQSSSDWLLAARPISVAVVSNDSSLTRFTTRGEISNYEFTLLTFSQVLENPSALRGTDALLLDLSDDIFEAFGLLEALKVQDVPLSHLIAICPPGRINDSLGNRLFELGFAGVLQKPLQYSRLVDVIRTTLARPLKITGSRAAIDPRGRGLE